MLKIIFWIVILFVFINPAKPSVCDEELKILLIALKRNAEWALECSLIFKDLNINLFQFF